MSLTKFPSLVKKGSITYRDAAPVVAYPPENTVFSRPSSLKTTSTHSVAARGRENGKKTPHVDRKEHDVKLEDIDEDMESYAANNNKVIVPIGAVYKKAETLTSGIGVTCDTEAIKSQLERITTLLEDGFRKQYQAKKMVEECRVPIVPPLKEITVISEPNHLTTHLSYKDLALLDQLNNTGQNKIVPGGTPITTEQAKMLRMMVYGSTVHQFSQEWRRSGVDFQFQESQFPYGLKFERNGSRGLLACMQAWILRYLIYRFDTKEEIRRRNVLDPNAVEKRRALVKAIATVLWRAGDSKQATICLPQSVIYVQDERDYRRDGVTEKLHLYKKSSMDEVEMFVKNNIAFFEKEFGCVLLLYSAMLSRTFARMLEDNGGMYPRMLSDFEECLQPTYNLFLFGKATRNVHNGNIVYNNDGVLLDHPHIGVPNRNDVGFLLWSKDEDEDARTQVGSMLRTPRKPVWVTLINNQPAVLFSLNPELVSDWRSEHRFQMHYYNGLPSQTGPAILTIETRVGRSFRARTAKSRKREEEKFPPLERCIMARWHGADIHWNGIMPFV